ncbi:MAG: nucleotidyl transferase AbiEii/AbiGii toxin family protein [Desulfovermiculus sp.]|nr:nucleotidyl transferase AbiEii/AbiGii toxin family protein [Desulfovermiculus sp.]
MKNLPDVTCLAPKAGTLLRELVASCPFLDRSVLVGGSALAMHLKHRQSEDLDFFTYAEGNFSKKIIRNYIKRFQQKEILNETDDQIDLLINGVKVTFFDAKWSFLRPSQVDKFNLASLEAIAAMKVNVLFLRATYRDYYDLYFLAQELGVRKIFDVSKDVVPGLTYKLFCTALLYIDDIADEHISHLKPKENISKKEIRSFLEKGVF